MIGFILAVVLTGGGTDVNKIVFDNAVALCKRSRCSSCGLFSYEEDGTKTGIRYVPSTCEERFLINEALERLKETDLKIRKTYG